MSRQEVGGRQEIVQMAGSMSRAFATVVLNHSLRSTASTARSSWMALCSDVPTDNTAGTAVTWTNYARIAVTFDAPTDADPCVCANQLITFAEAGSGPTTVKGWELYDAETTGNRMYWGDVNSGTGVSIASGDTPKVSAGNLTVSLN